MSRFRYGSLLCLSLLAACRGGDPAAEKRSRPNILLIVADDMGYTDVGFFGDEIATPNLDEIALDGLRFSNFHAGSSCSPTRAMLMSGVTNREVGVAGPAAVLADNVATLPAGIEVSDQSKVSASPSTSNDPDPSSITVSPTNAL